MLSVNPPYLFFFLRPLYLIIDDQHPGFARIRLMPHTPNDIKNFAAWKRTPRGILRTEWNEKEVAVTIPDGTDADFIYGCENHVLTAGQYRFARLFDTMERCTREPHERF